MSISCGNELLNNEVFRYNEGHHIFSASFIADQISDCKEKRWLAVEQAKRYGIFVIGMSLTALAVALFVKAAFGVTPVSSLTYVLSLSFPYTIGTFSFMVSIVAFLLQLLILRKKFPIHQWLQMPMTAIFSLCIDGWMKAFSTFTPDGLDTRIALLVLALFVHATGVTLQVKGNVVMLPPEAFVHAVATHWHFRFGNVKIFFDTAFVLAAATISFHYLGEIQGIREATLISAFSTGFLQKCFTIYIPEWFHRRKAANLG